MNNELKAQLFDEIINNMDNDDFIMLDKGTIQTHSCRFYTSLEEDDEVCFNTIEEALEELGYDTTRST